MVPQSEGCQPGERNGVLAMGRSLPVLPRGKNPKGHTGAPLFHWKGPRGPECSAAMGHPHRGRMSTAARHWAAQSPTTTSPRSLKAVQNPSERRTSSSILCPHLWMMWQRRLVVHAVGGHDRWSRTAWHEPAWPQPGFSEGAEPLEAGWRRPSSQESSTVSCSCGACWRQRGLGRRTGIECDCGVGFGGRRGLRRRDLLCLAAVRRGAAAAEQTEDHSQDWNDVALLGSPYQSDYGEACGRSRAKALQSWLHQGQRWCWGDTLQGSLLRVVVCTLAGGARGCPPASLAPPELVFRSHMHATPSPQHIHTHPPRQGCTSTST